MRLGVILMAVLLLTSYSNYIAIYQGNEKQIKIIEQINDDLTRYVNPFIGTGVYSKWGAMGRGNCYPGATVPFGMVQLSPDTGMQNHFAGYHYEDKYILGFSHNHLSGVGCPGMGDVLIMPIGSKIAITEDEYKSEFSHDKEEARPGYYMVYLESYGIKAELTTTIHCGMHRYTFPEGLHHIIIDVTHTLEDDKPRDAFVEIINNSCIAGYETIPNPFCGGKTPYTIYFYAIFSKPFEAYGTWKDDKIYFNNASQKGCDIGAFVNYTTAKNEIIEIKVGISYVSIHDAHINTREIPDWDFDSIALKAQQKWNEMLHVVEVEGSEENKIKFYTALYHSLLMPHVFNDSNGLYIGMDDEIYIANHTHYATFSLWDTFRSEHPLLTLLFPRIQKDMVDSLLEQYTHGGWLPKWPFLNRYTNCMIGDHACAVIADTYLKGIKFNISLAYEAMKKGAMHVPENGDFSGRIGLEYYISLGYVPYDKVDGSVSRTLEFAYDDWCIAQVAKALGKKNDYDVFMKRAANYKNVFDEKTKFMRPRYSNGQFKKFFIPSLWDGYTEGNAWTYSWFVPHDVKGLISLMGKETFKHRLNHFFRRFSYPMWYMPFSHYWHGNEPDQQAPYLYNFIDEPEKTQEIVRKIMDKLYDTTPSGIPGNDDCGQLSSWFVFNAMGFYPFCPGNTTYQFGSPIFEKVVIHLDKYYVGGTLTIIAKNASHQKHVRRIIFNGKPLDVTWIEHEELIKGGTLIFEMES